MRGVIDTGFTEALTLPAETIALLGLTRVDTVPMILADGSRVLSRAYSCAVSWDDGDRDIVVFACEGGALIGMALLHGCRVCMDVVDGGPVTIERL